MASFINTNTASLNAQRNLTTSQSSLATSLQRLSSGLRINSAKDDAAGLAISERMTSQIKGSDQAARNANDGISLAQTAEGDMAAIGTNLQRMRELAVQSANASNTDADRAAINGEVQSLSAEIDRVAQNSSFNGVKLLDGSFSAQSFQIGSNATANDSIKIDSISSARTSSLGSVGTSFAATLAGGKTTTALAAGDVTLNGFQVGASALGSAPGQSTASAFSVAAAINAISSQSGVTATANANVVQGVASGTGSISKFDAVITAGTFNINGVDVGAVAAGGNQAGQGANVAAAINKISTQTGVTAKADATSGALTLTAADGRDVIIGLGGAAAGTTASAQTTAAANAKTTFLTQTGLASGVVGTQATAGTTAVPATTATTGNLGAFTAAAAAATGKTYDTVISLTGTGLTTTTITDTISDAGPGDATSLAAALNTAGFSADGSTINGFKISTGGASTTVAAAITAGTLSFSRADGTNFTVATTAVGTDAPGTPSKFANEGTTINGVPAAAASSTAATFESNHGTVSLSSTSSSGIVYGGAALASAGFAAAGGTKQANTTSSVSSIASMDVLTAANASKAITAIDGALSTVNSSRASLGAYQNRFASVVSTLQTSSENLSASRSRIQDTDFAHETAQLTRGQILQQAGTAMLAQANSLPNGVLALLR